MAASDTPGAADLVRTSSQQSSASVGRKSSTMRVRPLKRSSNASLGRTPSPAADDKSLTSFPSLSPTPDSSPVQSRVNGWFRNALGNVDGLPKDGRGAENRPIPTSSPETIKAASPLDTTKTPTPASTVRKVTKSTQQIVGSLVASTPSARDRSALFDDTPPEAAKIPGNVHYASDQNIKDMVAQSGTVTLVRQMASDLAQRDAQITALRRRAEERERILRKMLQECEVSNMDIESRLRELDKGRERDGNAIDGGKPRKRGSDSNLSGMHPDDPMEQRLARAMEDEIAVRPDALGMDSGNVRQDSEAISINSASDVPGDGPRGNWKSYLWNGTSRKSSRAPSVASLVDRNAESQSVHTRSRASSGAKATRKPISSELFVPPGVDKSAGAAPTLRRLQSQDHTSNSSSRRSSVSIMNWTLKMVAGNSQAGRSSDKVNTVRGRKGSTSIHADRAASIDSTRTSQSAKSALSNVQKRGGRALGPNGTLKSIPSEGPKIVAAASSPHMPGRGISNLGPVEMDRILPEESRPPTLLQQHNRFATSNEYLTDRFGFIYDQRRKKRQNEAAAALLKQKRSSNVESLGEGRPGLHSWMAGEDEEDGKIPPSDGKHDSRSPSRPRSSSSGDQLTKVPTKTWADYLKLATHPTELLSHTPSSAPITSVDTAEAELSAPKPNQVSIAKRGSLPATSVNPEPSPSRIVSGNAEFSIVPPSGTVSPLLPNPTQGDPVKSLLDQLTELHDNLQKDKTVKWNEFLRKVRAERKRQGDAANASEGRSKGLDMPETLIADGEMVGVAGLGNKGKVGRAKWQEFRRLVLGGIPVAYRAKIWSECSGASALHIPGYYEDLINNGEDNPTIVTQIQMDITRTLTDNIFFRKGPGVQKLNEVLLAYSRRNPEVGYCQGMNLITASLLLIMPTAEEAFWALATMIENILPDNYYDQHLLTSRADQSVLREYVVELLPKLSNHLDMLEIELEALTFQWFLSVFTDCLSAEALYRVWDVVLCMQDGSTFLFQVALALLKLNEKQLLQCDTPAAIYHYINHQMTNHAISIDGLIQASDALNKMVKRRDVEERRARAVGHEQEIMRQREEARQERARKRASKNTVEEAAPPEVIPDKPPSISASLDAELSRFTSPLRTPLSSASRRSEEEEDAEALNQSLESLGSITPMPIQEEALWRA